MVCEYGPMLLEDLPGLLQADARCGQVATGRRQVGMTEPIPYVVVADSRRLPQPGRELTPKIVEMQVPDSRSPACVGPRVPNVGNALPYFIPERECIGSKF